MMLMYGAPPFDSCMMCRGTGTVATERGLEPCDSCLAGAARKVTAVGAEPARVDAPKPETSPLRAINADLDRIMAAAQLLYRASDGEDTGHLGNDQDIAAIDAAVKRIRERIGADHR